MHYLNTHLKRYFLKFSLLTFSLKMSKIRASLDSQKQSSNPLTFDEFKTNFSFDSFSILSEVEIDKIIKQSPSKSCDLDMLPRSLLKENMSSILPLITEIVNYSLSTGHVPEKFKVAYVTPLLKKAFLDKNVLKNYRPVSNLPFVSKVLEHDTWNIIGITESWIDNRVNDSEIFIPGYCVVRRDRDRNVGGVCVYVKSDTANNVRPDLARDNLEMVWVEIHLPHSKPILVGMCYIPEKVYKF